MMSERYAKTMSMVLTLPLMVGFVFLASDVDSIVRSQSATTTIQTLFYISIDISAIIYCYCRIRYLQEQSKS